MILNAQHVYIVRWHPGNKNANDEINTFGSDVVKPIKLKKLNELFKIIICISFAIT